MKILYVYFHNYNDMPYHTREWVEAAIKLGHEVDVITSINENFLESIGWKNKINVIQVKYPGKGFINYFKLVKNFKKVITEQIKKQKPDFIYERFSPISTAATFVSKKFNIPFCIELNGILDIELKKSRSSWLRKMHFNRIQTDVYKKCTHIISVTENIKEYIKNNFNIHSDKIKAIQNGVNIERFHPCNKLESRKKFNLPDKAFIIGYLGSLFSWYDLKITIRTAKEIIERIPEVIFLIGGGQEPIKSQLESSIKREGLEKYFRLAGQIHWDKAAEFTSTFDIAITPTNFSEEKYEVSPLKLRSYMACARNIIGADTLGMKKDIINSECGLLYCDDKSFKESVFAIYEMNDNGKKIMGEKGLEYVKEHYTWKQQVEKTINFIIKE